LLFFYSCTNHISPNPVTVIFQPVNQETTAIAQITLTAIALETAGPAAQATATVAAIETQTQAAIQTMTVTAAVPTNTAIATHTNTLIQTSTSTPTPIPTIASNLYIGIWVNSSDPDVTYASIDLREGSFTGPDVEGATITINGYSCYSLGDGNYTSSLGVIMGPMIPHLNPGTTVTAVINCPPYGTYTVSGIMPPVDSIFSIPIPGASPDSFMKLYIQQE
jgi:hypothetical protein